MKLKQTEDVYKYAIIDGEVEKCKVRKELEFNKSLICFENTLPLFATTHFTYKENQIISNNMLFDTYLEAEIRVKLKLQEELIENIQKEVSSLRKNLLVTFWFATIAFISLLFFITL